MQSLGYKLKTSNTNYVTARHDVQYFPSSLSSFSPATSRVCRIPLTSGTSFIDPESIKIAFRVRNTDATRWRHGRTVAVHDLLKGREYNQNKAVEGFDKVNNSRTPRAVHQSGYADVLLRPTMVGILRCGKMLPPQLSLVIETECADATTALWSGGGHAEHRLRDPERPSSGLPGRFGLCVGGVLQPRAFVRKVPGVQLPHGAHAAVHGASGRGGAQRHRGACLHETHGSVRDFLGQRRGL